VTSKVLSFIAAAAVGLPVGCSAPTSLRPGDPAIDGGHVASESGTAAHDAAEERIFAADAADVADASTPIPPTPQDCDTFSDTTIYGAPCGSVVLSGPCVANLAVPALAPTATGGVPVNGTYDLVAYTSYTGPGGVSGDMGYRMRQTMTLSNGVLDSVIATAPGLTWELWTLSFSGTQMTEVGTCPDLLGPYTRTYSATPDELDIFSPTFGTDAVDVTIFMRRSVAGRD
jgi:hypothetical protein